MVSIKPKNNLPNTYYSAQAIKGTLLLPPKNDYNDLFVNTCQLLKNGFDIKSAITLSFNENRESAYRKILHVNSAILRYLNLQDKDNDIELEILSALVLLSENDRNTLLNMCENPEQYIKKENKDKEIDNFIDFYSSYLNMRKGVENRLKIYATKKTESIKIITSQDIS